MALFRSEVLNHDFFKKALEDAEQTRYVEVNEITIGEVSYIGLQEIIPVQICANIRGRTKVFNWTAKLNSSSESASKLGKELNLCEKEVYVYTVLLPNVELISNNLKLAVPAHPDLIHHAETDTTSALLLTDLTLAGFEPALANINLEINTVELLVNWLAGLHAHSYAYFQGKSSWLGKQENKPPAFLVDLVPLAGRSVSSEEGLVELVKLFQPPLEDYASRLKTLFATEAYSEICRKVFGERTDKFCTVCHGSPWMENALIWKDDEQIREVVFINYQQARFSQPATDIAILLYTSTSKEFRKEHLSRVLKTYHNTLTETLGKLGFGPDTYPFSDLFQDYQDAMIPAIGMAVTVLPGLVRESGDEVDSKRGDDSLGGGKFVSDKINEMMEELIEDGLL